MKPERPRLDGSLIAMLVVMTATGLWFFTSVIGYV